MTRSEISTDRVPSSTDAPTIATAPLDEFTYCICIRTLLHHLSLQIQMHFQIQDALHSQVQHQLCSNSTGRILMGKIVWQMDMLADLVAEMRQTSLASVFQLEECH